MNNWTDLSQIQTAIDNEARRIKIASRFLPLPQNVITSGSPTVVSDIISSSQGVDPSLIVAEGDTTSFYQITVKFKLSDTQYADQSGRMTAITLATRAANLLSQAEDILVFQGEAGEKIQFLQIKLLFNSLNGKMQKTQVCYS